MQMPIGKKQEIVEAAIALIAAGGNSALTATALAQATGMSKANIFHHFKTIDDIVIAALEQFIQSMPAMTPSLGTSLRDWLIALGSDTVEVMEAKRQEAGAYLAFIARAQSEALLRARLEEVARGAEDAFTAAIELLAPGRFTQPEICRLANLILMAGDGLAIHRQLFPDRSAQQQQAWLALVDCIAPREVRP